VTQLEARIETLERERSAAGAPGPGTTPGAPGTHPSQAPAGHPGEAPGPAPLP